MFKFSRLFLGLVCSMSVFAANAELASSEYVVEKSRTEQAAIPCPFGFSVKLNPSVPNSLVYKDEGSKLAVSVTAIKQLTDSPSSPEAYAKASAKQLACSVPVLSSLVADGYSFVCENEGIEAIVYGDDAELVLLAISGRDRANEEKLEQFIKFLDDEAKKQ